MEEKKDHFGSALWSALISIAFLTEILGVYYLSKAGETNLESVIDSLNSIF